MCLRSSCKTCSVGCSVAQRIGLTRLASTLFQVRKLLNKKCVLIQWHILCSIYILLHMDTFQSKRQIIVS